MSIRHRSFLWFFGRCAQRSARAGAATARTAFLETYAGITGYALPSADPQVVSPEDMRILGAHQCKRLIQLSAIAVLLSHPGKAGSVVFLKALSRHLGIRDSVIDVVDALENSRHVRVRMLAMRRAFRAMFKEAYPSEGFTCMLAWRRRGWEAAL